MKKSLICCAVLFGAVTAITIQPSNARERQYKYCLFEGRSGGASDCSFETYSQCAASASGRVAECRINPMYVEPRRQR